MIMFLHALEKSGLDKIQHFYLEKGHTQNENDSVHSTIERATRHIPLYTPDQWFTAVRSARISKPYIVEEMTRCDFLDFKSLAQPFKNFQTATDGSKIAWGKIRVLKFLKDSKHCVYFSYGHNSDFKTLDILQKHRGKKPNMAQLVAQKFSATSPNVCISKAKYDDLLGLCRDNLIPASYHAFYNTLKWQDNDADTSEEEMDVD